MTHQHNVTIKIEGLDEIIKLLINQNQKLDKMATDLTAITAGVAANTDVIESAITLLGNIKAQLDAAGTDPVALKALSDTLASEDQKLADAIVANTPQAPKP